jgi:hypothetical protein
MIVRSGSAVLARLLSSGAVQVGLGLGSADHPESHAQTALGADGTLGAAWYRPVDPGFPAVSSDGELVVQATFDPGEALFPVREWCVFVADGPIYAHHELVQTGDAAAMLSRKLADHQLIPLTSRPYHRVVRVPLRFFVPD